MFQSKFLPILVLETIIVHSDSDLSFKMEDYFSTVGKKAMLTALPNNEII